MTRMSALAVGVGATVVVGIFVVIVVGKNSVKLCHICKSNLPLSRKSARWIEPYKLTYEIMNMNIIVALV